MDERYLEKIPRFSWADFKKHLTEKKPFETISPMATTLFRVKSYEQPLIAVASHAGHRVREELQIKMAIEESDRLYEEDYAVEQIVSEFPIQMIGLDSRYEYDLNRAREQAIYLKPFQSWGKKVWITPPTKEELEISVQKYDEFHEMLEYFVEFLIAQFGKAWVWDVHAYNFRRPQQLAKAEDLPTFHVATSEKDQKKYRKTIDFLSKALTEQTFGATNGTFKENTIFKKDGAIAKNLDTKFDTCWTLPFEIKKVYMDEKTGELKPQAVGELRSTLAATANQALKTLG